MEFTKDYNGDEQWLKIDKNRVNLLKIPNEFVNLLYEYRNDIKDVDEVIMAIETGTYKAETTKILANHFDRVYTIELYPDNNPYDRSNNRGLYEKLSVEMGNIEFLMGIKSTDGLKMIISENPDKRFFILLDAHTTDIEPVKEELLIIKNNSKRNDHIIMIDDCRDLGKGNSLTKDELISVIKDMNENYKIIETKIGNTVTLIY